MRPVIIQIAVSVDEIVPAVASAVRPRPCVAERIRERLACQFGRAVGLADINRFDRVSAGQEDDIADDRQTVWP